MWSSDYLQLAQYVDFVLEQMQSAQNHTDVIPRIAAKTSIIPISKLLPNPLSRLAQIAPVSRALYFYGGMLSPYLSHQGHTFPGELQ